MSLRILFLLFASALATPLTYLDDQTSLQQTRFENDVRVPVQLGVMSRCPDALACESVFDQVLQRIRPKVDISLIYVAQLDSSEPEFGVTCMHGPYECSGNVQQLCVSQYLSSVDWWEFVQCQNAQGRYKLGTPESALECARSTNIDWLGSGAGTCAGLDGSGKAEEGVQLLRESVKLTNSLGIQKSCTVVINGKKVCVRDGTWKECEGGHEVDDFVNQIETEYENLNKDRR